MKKAESAAVFGKGALKIDISRRDDVTVLHFNGEFIYDLVDEFQQYTDTLTDQDLKKVVLDFSGLEWLDSAAISAFLNLIHRCSRIGGRVAACSAPLRVSKILNLTRINLLLKTGTSFEDVKRHLG
ncbi:MAG: STAS domain-containing protein [Candidatus Wallbacteria bacterium]|nr:STAS domain-containing protein [Candidatus Wallbacteria bacterium]